MGAWQYTLGEIQKELNKSDFEAYVRPLKLGPLIGSVLHARIANRFALEWLNARMRSSMTSSLRGVLGHEISLVFEVDVGEVKQQPIARTVPAQT